MKIALLRKTVDLTQSEILWKKGFTPEILASDFEVGSGEWTVVDGKLRGSHPAPGGGMLYTRKSWPGDIVIDFTGYLEPPYDHDLNFVLKTEGYDRVKNDAGRGYIGGISGWYEQKAGIEKYPTCFPAALMKGIGVKAGESYRMQAGAIGGHIFLALNGEALVEMYDDTYTDFDDFGHVGIGLFASVAVVSDLTIYRPFWQERMQSYSSGIFE